MFILLSFFWFIRTTKAILFWLYLWQLKEYHLGRFLDHFRTEKGRQLIFNKLLIFKILLVLIFLYGLSLFSFRTLPPPVFSPNISLDKLFVGLPFLIFILYIFETARLVDNLFRRTLKKPVLTKKTAFLILTALVLEILFIIVLFLCVKNEWSDINFILAAFYLLLFDILTPIITSAIVLFFQPLTVLARNQIIRKAKQKREKFKDLLVIGITGSYGKTSTKEFLATILAEKFGQDKILKTKEHQNSEIGISQCILDDLNKEHQIFVVEMGAYNKGGIKLLCDIVKPKFGIITGINEQHLSTFGTMKNLLSAEGGEELIQALPENSLIIFNGNNKYCQEIYKKTKKLKKISYSYNTFSTAVGNVLSLDIWAKEVKVEKEKLFFKVFSKDGEKADFKVSLLGAQNIESILLAICCAKELMPKTNLEEMARICQKLKPTPLQMELKKGMNGLNIIDATYSANPDGTIAHLDYLKVWPNKKVMVMPCLIELGPVSKEIHCQIGRKISQVCDLAIITTKDYFKEIKEGAGEKAVLMENPKEILEKIKDFCGQENQENVVLLEGRVPKKLINYLLHK